MSDLKKTLSALWGINEGLITHLLMTDKISMDAKYICGSKFGIGTNYKGTLKPSQKWSTPYCEGYEYEQWKG